MGYWSSHPLGGDEPMDRSEDFKRNFMLTMFMHLCNKQENGTIDDDKGFNLYEEYLDYNYEQQENIFKKYINTLIEVGTKEQFKYYIKFSIALSKYNKNVFKYIIPFTILNYLEEYAIDSNEGKINLNYIKGMLGDTDGGSEYRGYNKFENTYPNSISTPEDYVRTTYDNWDKIINKEYDYKSNLVDKGLLYEAIKSEKEGYDGLINTK